MRGVGNESPRRFTSMPTGHSDTPLSSSIIKEDKSHISEFSVLHKLQNSNQNVLGKGLFSVSDLHLLQARAMAPTMSVPHTSTHLSFYKCPFPLSSHSLLIKTATLP